MAEGVWAHAGREGSTDTANSRRTATVHPLVADLGELAYLITLPPGAPTQLGGKVRFLSPPTNGCRWRKFPMVVDGVNFPLFFGRGEQTLNVGAPVRTWIH